jgi:hypothetical protein
MGRENPVFSFNMYALDKMGFAVGWREGGVEMLYQRLSCVQPALRVARCEIALGETLSCRQSRALARRRGLRRQIASRFWCSVNLGLRPSSTLAFARPDQYNYDFCGVVEEKTHPTWLLSQTILDA